MALCTTRGYESGQMDCADAGEDARTTAGETPALQMHPLFSGQMSQ